MAGKVTAKEWDVDSSEGTERKKRPRREEENSTPKKGGWIEAKRAKEVREEETEGVSEAISFTLGDINRLIDEAQSRALGFTEDHPE